MNIPSKVRIGSMDYKVEITDNVVLVNHSECYGDINHDDKIIRICNCFKNKQVQELTFLHEVIHGIAYERNLVYEKQDEETITEELALGLHGFIRDNPEVFNV